MAMGIPMPHAPAAEAPPRRGSRAVQCSLTSVRYFYGSIFGTPHGAAAETKLSEPSVRVLPAVGVRRTVRGQPPSVVSFRGFCHGRGGGSPHTA